MNIVNIYMLFHNAKLRFNNNKI